ncbi:MAG: hypothetical protein H0V34_15360 [Gammaproteobacteria bacterium]|nr:hypothetical protein [Gammaproteobacteria bacterium]
MQNQIMPAAGVDLPLVQLYGDITVPPVDSFGSPYDMVSTRPRAPTCRPSTANSRRSWTLPTPPGTET